MRVNDALKISAELKVYASAEFYNPEATQETLRYQVEQALNEYFDDVEVSLLKEQPEQKRGHWKAFTQSRFFGMDDDGEPIFRDGRFYVCSSCRRKSIIQHPYCPMCGAKMDKEVKKDD